MCSNGTACAQSFPFFRYCVSAALQLYAIVCLPDPLQVAPATEQLTEAYNGHLAYDLIHTRRDPLIDQLLMR